MKEKKLNRPAPAKYLHNDFNLERLHIVDDFPLKDRNNNKEGTIGGRRGEGRQTCISEPSIYSRDT